LDATLRGRELVRQMLTFSRRIEKGKKLLQLGNLVADTMKLLRPSIPSSIKIRIKSDGEPDFIIADPTRMEQVLMNLCANAAHAMHEKGGVLDVIVSRHMASGDGGADGVETWPLCKARDSRHGGRNDT
jgi:signal transduction histidine kinase